MCFYTQNLSRTFSQQASTYLCSLLIIVHIKNGVIVSLKNKLFKEMFSTFAVVDPTHQKLKNIDPTRPNPTHGQPNPWTTVRRTLLSSVLLQRLQQFYDKSTINRRNGAWALSVQRGVSVQ